MFRRKQMVLVLKIWRRRRRSGPEMMEQQLRGGGLGERTR
jgi:hypothetical protein